MKKWYIMQLFALSRIHWILVTHGESNNTDKNFPKKNYSFIHARKTNPLFWHSGRTTQIIFLQRMKDQQISSSVSSQASIAIILRTCSYKFITLSEIKFEIRFSAFSSGTKRRDRCKQNPCFIVCIVQDCLEKNSTC